MHHYLCKQFAAYHKYKYLQKLSCCIVQILILTNTAKFMADTDTGIGIGASLTTSKGIRPGLDEGAFWYPYLEKVLNEMLFER